MPWKETCVMDEKVKLIADWLSEDYSITDLSEIYRVSRRTIYKWIERYQNLGADGLKDKTSAPLTRPWATPPDIVSYLLAAKSRHSKWGPRKLVAWLKNHYPEKRWPVASTAQTILKREGWVKTRHRRHHAPAYTEPFINSKTANDVWCADFKGQFKLGGDRYCYPLTITDSYSRYLLSCHGLYHPAFRDTREEFERVFKDYGLPLAIRTDNGAPFASVALGGLSSLAVWFIKLGITPERIEPGRPDQNGRHERFHRTLKDETLKPPCYTLAAQQRAFDRFRVEYNTERPHEARGQKPPASAYHRSIREYPATMPDIKYPDDYLVRQVRIGGPIRWKGGLIYVSKALTGEPVGLKRVDDQLWEVYYSFLPIGIFDEELGRIIAL
jgi:transposase InsO family protein